MFVRVIERILLDTCITVQHQAIVVDFYEMLIQKKYIPPNNEQTHIENLLPRLKIQLQQFHEAGNTVDTDAQPALINSAFLLSFFATHFRLSGRIKNDVYHLAYDHVIGQPLDLTKNRNLLGNYKNLT